MPTTLTESDTFPATVQVPNAAELASAPGLASLYLQPVANRLRYLYLRLTSGTVSSVTPASNAFSSPVQIPDTTALPLPNAFSRMAQPLADQTNYLRKRSTGRTGGYQYIVTPCQPVSSSGWNPFEPQISTGFGVGGWTITTNVINRIIFPLPILPRSQSDAPLYLKDVAVALKPLTGHGGPPANMPILKVLSLTDAGMQELATATDVFGSIAAYEAAHSFAAVLATGHEIQFNPGGGLYLSFDAEWGAGAVAGTRLINFVITVQETA